jgi:(2R)-ethylmalonyl-CoA mutase
VLRRLKEEGIDVAKVPLVVGGIIPDVDAQLLRDQGVAAVLTPKDRDITAGIGRIAAAIEPASA